MAFEINNNALDFTKINNKLNGEEMFLLGVLFGTESMIASFIENNTDGELDDETLEATVNDIFGLDEKIETWNTSKEIFQADVRSFEEIMQII